jgi:hypothetical protein
MDDIKWIAQRIRRPLKDVKADKRYDAAARKEVSPSSYSRYGNGYNGTSNSSVSPGVHSTQASERLCDIYEYYDIDTGEMSVFSDSLATSSWLNQPRCHMYLVILSLCCATTTFLVSFTQWVSSKQLNHCSTN